MEPKAFPIPDPPEADFEALLIPAPIERSTLLDLIEISRDRVPIEWEVTIDNQDPISDIFAMLKARDDFDVRLNSLPDPPPGMSEATRQHLVRMIVVHSELISRVSLGRSGIIDRIVRNWFEKEFRDFEAIDGSDGPDSLPEAWKLAYDDAWCLRVRMESQQ